MSSQIDEIIDYWYSDNMSRHWFNSTDVIDEQIRNRYEVLWQSARDGRLNHWMESAQGCLALIIILDQLPLNMFRGQAESFSTEQQAIIVARYAIDKGFDKSIPKQQLAFLYMPLMHSENIQDQNLSVSCFETAGLDENAKFARHHRDIVIRFGRFPHRNAILNRDSSEQERVYLASVGAFTG
ncbi:MAG: DUF924 family protein [Gammaproteobacteria bacterium]